MKGTQSLRTFHVMYICIHVIKKGCILNIHPYSHNRKFCMKMKKDGVQKMDTIIRQQETGRKIIFYVTTNTDDYSKAEVVHNLPRIYKYVNGDFEFT